MIELILPIDGLECDIEAESMEYEGKHRLTRVRIKPLFSSPESTTTICHIRSTTEGGQLLYRKILRQSGSTGDISLRDRATDPVIPRFETTAFKSEPDQDEVKDGE